MSLASRKLELRQSVIDCSERGLVTAAKWSAQLLAGLPSNIGVDDDPAPASSSGRTEEADAFQLARACFELKEYRSAAYTLRGAGSPKAVFLRCFATFLAGEKRKEEERVEKSAGQANVLVVNSEVQRLEGELRAAVAGAGAGGGAGQGGKAGADSFLLYLLGLVLSQREDKREAREVLTQSVAAYPCNWSAWQALQAVCPDVATASSLPLPDHYMRSFFLASLCVDLNYNDEALQHLQGLDSLFPSSEAVVQLAALAHYNLQNFDEAQELFEDLLGRDPHRIEGMDSYSNILYVKEEFAAISHLAHRCAASDKYRPETCAIIGNYYSLKGQHEKAVMYFRRALKLNPHYLSAWTLMGHEYVEMKNPPAAIEAYRHAVDVSPRDYRAWYGLGQTYELVNMPYYALYYFRRAVQLRPHDARMWNAMGNCYQQEQLGMLDAAVRCHRRALPYDKEGVAVHELAKLHARLGQRDQAAHYHKLNLDRMEAEGVSGQDAVEALTFLAEHHQARGELELAEQYFTRLLDYGGGSKEKAKGSLREIRSLKARGGGLMRTPGGTGVRPDSPAGGGGSGGGCPRPAIWECHPSE